MSNSFPNETLFHARVNGEPIQIDRQEKLLSLHFCNGIIESRINTDDPSILPLRSNRQMLSGLMFGHVPKKIMLVGCGGGAIARWFNHHLPDSQGIALERSATIINLAYRYFDFPSVQEGWQIFHGEASQFLQTCNGTYDLIITDLEVDQKTPDWVSSEKFLLNCRRLLSQNGILNINLIADTAENFARQLWPVRQVFKGLTYCHANDANNVFVSAFRNRPGTKNLQALAEKAEKTYGIEFPLFYSELLRDNPSNSGIF